jgi:hypothetical protein
MTTMNPYYKEQKIREYNAVKRWVRDSLSAGNYEDWEWDDTYRVLTIYCKDELESDKGLVEQYSWEELVAHGLVINN